MGLPGLPGLQGEIRLPGDKSIGHRALILSALCPGTSQIEHLPNNHDVAATRHCLEALGMSFSAENTQDCADRSSNGLIVQTPEHFSSPTRVLDAQNSGTTLRLLSGLLCAMNLSVELTGDAALQKRPMARVVLPLRQMGAVIHGRQSESDVSGEHYAPIQIEPAPQGLQGIDYTLPVASAQVKSALILAGLFARGVTRITEPIPTRDHTERMLSHLGVGLRRTGCVIEVPGGHERHFPPTVWKVPGDISSAAFFIAAASLTPGSRILLRDVGLNPLRTGILDVLQEVGACILIENPRVWCGEPVGDLVVETRPLKGNIRIDEATVPRLIDEIPILAVMGVFLDGILEIHGADELRKKESDRIQAIADEFAKLGIFVETFPDGLRIQGEPDRRLTPPKTPLSAHHDHRIAMALTVLNRVAEARSADTGMTCRYEPWPMDGREWANVSFPDFFNVYERLTAPSSATC